jgi:hypothetical protein
MSRDALTHAIREAMRAGDHWHPCPTRMCTTEAADRRLLRRRARRRLARELRNEAADAAREGE